MQFFFVYVKKIWTVIHVSRSALTFCLKRKHWIQICLNSNYLSGQRNHSPSSTEGSFVQPPPPKKKKGKASVKCNYKCKYKDIMESVLLSICVALLFKFQLISARWCRPRRNVWSLWQRTTWRGVNRSWSSCGETITARGLTLFFLRLHKHHRTETTWWKSCNLQEMTLLQQV